MTYDGTVLNRAIARLQEERRLRQQEVEHRRQRAYQREPRLAQLDRQIQGTMAQVVAAALGQGKSAQEALKTVRQNNLDLQSQRASLLQAIGMNLEDLEEGPGCPDCGDRGWVGSAMCHCLKRLYAQEQSKELSTLLHLGDQSFQTFSLSYYSTQPSGEWGCSPQENMAAIYKLCQSYAQQFGHFSLKNLLLAGPPGLGKTFLSACIARTVSQTGWSVAYDTATQIFAHFETRKFQREGEEVQRAVGQVRRYLSCDLLILDDLGSELTTPFIQTALYELLNTRLMAERATVISSNLKREEIQERYTSQIASRLLGEYHILHFFGTDIRQLKKKGSLL